MIMEIEQDFTIRPYLKAELAMMYHPQMTQKAAMEKMRRWINLNPELKRRVTEMQVSVQTHHYTSRQVAVLVEFLGEP
jgi:hypothetical protein